MFSDPGYVPLPHTKIDFSSDVEKSDPKKKRKVLFYSMDEMSNPKFGRQL